MATSNEIVREAFELKKPEKVPVGISLGGSWPIITEGHTLKELLDDAKKTADIFYDVFERLDVDWVTVGTGATALVIEALGGDVRFNEKGAPEIISLLINNERDIDILSIENALKKPRVQWLRDVAYHLAERNEGRKSVFVSGRAPFTLAGQLFGLENLSRALYKNKKLAHKLLSFTTELSIAYFEKMLEVDGIDGAFVPDPSASGDVVSVKHFEEFVLPYLTKVINAIKEKGYFTMIHICGNITDRLHLLPETGVDFISLDSKVDLKKAKEIVGGKIGISGNVNPVSVLEDKSPKEVYDESLKCIEDGGKDGGFILLPGCDISANVPECNVAAFVNAAHNWKY